MKTEKKFTGTDYVCAYCGSPFTEETCPHCGSTEYKKSQERLEHDESVQRGLDILEKIVDKSTTSSTSNNNPNLSPKVRVSIIIAFFVVFIMSMIIHSITMFSLF